MLRSLLAFAAGLILTLPLLAGDIEGTVEVRLRTPSPHSPISPFARSRSYESNSAGHELIAVIYLDQHLSLPAGEPPVEPVVMDQRNLTLIPHILPIMAGMTVRFPNSDALYHNLFSLSPARKFDLGRYPKGVTKSVRFDKPGEVHIFCDIHPSMSSIILVLPNHFFVPVGSDGTFRMTGIPAGTYSLNAWHEQLDDIKQEVTVPELGIINVNIILGN